MKWVDPRDGRPEARRIGPYSATWPAGAIRTFYEKREAAAARAIAQGRDPNVAAVRANNAEKSIEEADRELPGKGGNSADQEASAIAGSPEAKAQPQLALTAIEAGLTYEQFRATAAVVAARPRARGLLDQALANSPRVGPDAVGDDYLGRAARIDVNGIYARRRAAVTGMADK